MGILNEFSPLKANKNGNFLDFIENSISFTQHNDNKIKKLSSGSFLVGQMSFLGHFQLKVFSIFPKCPKMAQNGPKLLRKWSK